MSTLLTPPQPIRPGRPTPQASPGQGATIPAIVLRDTAVPAADELAEVTPAASRIEPISPPADDDAQMARAMKMGVLVGIPSVFLIAAGMAVLAGTGLGIAAMIGAWSGVFGGTYMGGIFFLHPSKPKPAVDQEMKRNATPSTIKAMP